MHPGAVEAYLHEAVAPRLIGRDPLSIDAISRDLVDHLGFAATGVETRAASAVDIGLWDIFGKLPINQSCSCWAVGRGKKSKPTTPALAPTICASENRNRPKTGDWTQSDPALGLNDLDAFLNRADELAQSLLDEGITAMKIWPFDIAAEASKGWSITNEELKSALKPFEKIRKAVGDRMDIMVEFHSMWQLMPAIRIARALAPFDTYWHEDPIKMDTLGDLKRYAENSLAPVCASETLATRFRFRDLLETQAAGVVMLDLAWCGGMSEARKIAAMAEAWKLPIAPHDCTGPVVLAASTHLSLNAPNALIQEVCPGLLQDLVSRCGHRKFRQSKTA